MIFRQIYSEHHDKSVNDDLFSQHDYHSMQWSFCYVILTSFRGSMMVR